MLVKGATGTVDDMFLDNYVNAKAGDAPVICFGVLSVAVVMTT